MKANVIIKPDYTTPLSKCSSYLKIMFPGGSTHWACLFKKSLLLTTSCIWSCDCMISRLTFTWSSIVWNIAFGIATTGSGITINFFTLSILTSLWAGAFWILAACTDIAITSLPITAVGVLSTINWNISVIWSQGFLEDSVLKLTTSIIWRCHRIVTRVTFASSLVVWYFTRCICSTCNIITSSFLTFSILTCLCACTLWILCTSAGIVVTSLSVIAVVVMGAINWNV